MANEITYSADFRVKETDGIDEDWKVSREQFNLADAGVVNSVLSIGTSEEVISFGDLASPAWVAFKNLDPDNFVQIGPESGGALIPFLNLPAGYVSPPVPVDASMVLRAKADTAACLVQVLIVGPTS